MIATAMLDVLSFLFAHYGKTGTNKAAERHSVMYLHLSYLTDSLINRVSELLRVFQSQQAHLFIYWQLWKMLHK